MSLSQSHVALSYEGPVPPAFLDEFRSAVAIEGLDLRIEPRPSGRAMASIDWLMPTAVLAYVGKAYFDVFLEDIAKSHLDALKRGIKTLGQRMGQVRYARIASRGKLPDADRYSSLFSVWTERAEGGRFKMLVAEGLTDARRDIVLDAYMTFAQAYHTRGLEPDDLAILAEAQPLGGVVLLAYDFASGSIQLVDPLAALRGT
jgi:hypothetical protein